VEPKKRWVRVELYSSNECSSICSLGELSDRWVGLLGKLNDFGL